MKRPRYRLCQFCGEKSGRDKKICPVCGRLMVRNLRAAGTAELLAEDGVPYLCNPERRRESRIPFEQVKEEMETGCAAGSKMKNT